MRTIEREGTTDPRVLEAFRATRRNEFVPLGAEDEAYRDRPVGLPGAQTTSQPSLIARMVEAARVGSNDVVLEVGTGFGYQTAVLARLAARVFTIDRLKALAESARSNLDRQGLENVEVVVGDGWNGHAAGAPYDAIIVSAAAESLPGALADQLAEGGRIVIPVKRGAIDSVELYVKENGRLSDPVTIVPARFVPLIKDWGQRPNE